MPSDPPLHVALGPDLRRPSVRLLKVIPVGLPNRLRATDANDATAEPLTLTPQRYIKPLAPRQLNHSASTTGRRFAKPLTREEARQKTQPYVPKRTPHVGPSTLGSIPQARNTRGVSRVSRGFTGGCVPDPYAR